MISATPKSSTALSLEEQLRQEIRVCPKCQCEITSPFITRCPRCLTAVPTQALGCTSCVHKKSCPVIPSSAEKSL
jgi:hypothetical protein